MYEKRIKIFIILSACLLLICVLRLTQMQLIEGSFYRDRIAKLKLQKGRSRQLKTVRGKILDRKGRILAVDEPQLQLCINYTLSSVLDERVRQANGEKQPEARQEDLQQVIDKCALFKGARPSEVRNEIEKINNFIWNRRLFAAWRNNFPDSQVFKKYNSILSIPLSKAMADFEKNLPNRADRLRLVNKVDISEMHKPRPLLELKTDDDIFTAQLEFLDIDGVEILPKARRVYPFGSAAAQVIGWVGPEHNKKLFTNDKLSSYLEGEVSGRRPGVEYVCETILRGRRGEVVYDIDRQLINRIETQFGKDVSLTLDIELQQRIEEYLANCGLNPTNCKAPTAAVVIDVATGDILALVSTPVFDLNRIRYDYADIAADPNEPLRNRAIYKQYPPGSVIKPLILIAGLESEQISPYEVINCPAQKAPNGWPNCWIYNRYNWRGHNDQWQNNARNAIKGSCNIYFSRLADRIDPLVLQQWLLAFGYGQKILSPPAAITETVYNRSFRQAPGKISSGTSEGTISHSERRLFGIGQGNLRVSPLQVANAIAAIARGGIFKQPRLFKEIQNSESVALGISPQTLDVVRDGMSAVVNEFDGTAYKEFAHAGFAEQGIKIYGKTGSTEDPDNAWFAGFAEDSTSRSIAVAVIVEGGQHGSSDAAPLARDIIQFCIDAGYIANPPN